MGPVVCALGVIFRTGPMSSCSACSVSLVSRRNTSNLLIACVHIYYIGAFRTWKSQDGVYLIRFGRCQGGYIIFSPCLNRQRLIFMELHIQRLSNTGWIRTYATEIVAQPLKLLAFLHCSSVLDSTYCINCSGGYWKAPEQITGPRRQQGCTKWRFIQIEYQFCVL